jgi:hypothetical protein
LNAHQCHCTDMQNIIQRIFFKYVLENSLSSNKVCVCVYVCVCYVTYQEDLRQFSVATRPMAGRPRNRGLFPGLGRGF